MEKVVRIGNSSGFWGDEPLALKQQLSGGKLDFVVADYLAEVSMSILSKQQAKNPEMGFVYDFIEHLSLAKDFLHLPVKIITNAGGNHPIACAKMVSEKLKSWGINKRVFAITGDNIFPHINQLMAENEAFTNLETKESFQNVKDKMVAANAYTDSKGILKALDAGADIVITGRASDSALVIGPLRYAFGWKATDYDLLAAGMTAGHIIECGTQSSGGNFTDWHLVPDFEHIGFPIIEMKANGDFMVTKHPNTGGLVSVHTVKEQLVYEINHPAQYLGPDVVADFTQLKIVQSAENKVLVTGAKGYAPPKTWKVSMAYQNGFKAIGGLMMSNPLAKEKAALVAKTFWSKLPAFKKNATQFIGLNACHGEMSHSEANEILLQLVAFDENKSKLEQFAKQIAAMILTGPQGLAATGGRPKLQEVVSYWPTLVDKTKLIFTVWEVNNSETIKIESYSPVYFDSEPKAEQKTEKETFPNNVNKTNSSTRKGKLYEICLARSGDKGNAVNIGVIARSEAMYCFLDELLTIDFIKLHFKSLVKGNIHKYKIPNLGAFNFFLEDALDGGGTYSGRIDPQGKTFASALLNLECDIPIYLFETQ